MIGDFIARTATVDRGGRRYVCRRATVATVIRALDVFADYIAGALMVDLSGTDVELEKMLLATAALENGRAAAVLETCVDGQPGEIAGLARVDPSLCKELLAAVLSVTDLRRILGSLDFTHIGSARPQPEQDRPLAVEVNLVHVAMAFGKSPAEVMDWPYELLLGVEDVLHLPPEHDESDFLKLTRQMAEDRAARA